MKNKNSAEKWKELCAKLGQDFGEGDALNLEGVLFLIGVNELGKGKKKYKKDQKMELMHIAICTVLEPLGYYEFEKYDAEGWPHFTLKEKLPALKPGQQSVLMKEAVITYFENRGFFEEVMDEE